MKETEGKPGKEAMGPLCWLLRASVQEIGLLCKIEQAFLPKHVRYKYNQQGVFCVYILTCAGYLGYPFEKSRNCASKIPLSYGHYEEIDALARNIKNRQANVQRIFTQMSVTKQRIERCPRFLERKRDK
jgi:hypothetical protein